MMCYGVNFAHPSIGAIVGPMIHIVWHAYLAVACICELPKDIVSG